MYLAILWRLQYTYVCEFVFHEIWSGKVGTHFQYFRQFFYRSRCMIRLSNKVSSQNEIHFGDFEKNDIKI
jgi:hypothetical protein